jgi:hypothetical protein
MMRPRLSWWLPILLAGCDAGPPTGQVVARVDGEEITRRDLLIELQASGLAPGVDVRRLQAALVERIVARKLLGEAARREGIDTTPDFLAAIRRDREERLIQFLDRRDEQAIAPPSARSVGAWVARRADAYAGRRLLTIDRLQVAAAGPSDPVDLTGSIDAVAERIDRSGRRYARTTISVDSLTLPEQRVAALERTTAAAPLRSRLAGQVQLERLVAAIPAPIAPAAQEAMARSELSAIAAAEVAARRIARLRAHARIEYQPGYAR